MFLTLALLATVVTFSSCSEDEDGLEQATCNTTNVKDEIKFNVDVPQMKVTRGMALNSSDFLDYFSAVAFINIDERRDEGDSNSELYFGGITSYKKKVDNSYGIDCYMVEFNPVDFVNKDGVWSSEFPYCWPSDESSKLSVIAWYPREMSIYGVTNGTSSEDNDTTSYFEFPTSLKDVTYNYKVPEDISQQKDAMIALSKNVDRNSYNGSIPLTFYHLLSQIKFAVNRDSIPEGYSISISNIRLCGVNNGDSIRGLHQPVSNYDYSVVNGSIEHGRGNVELSTGTYRDSEGNEIRRRGALLLPAQHVKAWDPTKGSADIGDGNNGFQSYLEITCTVRYENSQLYTDIPIDGHSEDFTDNGKIYIPFEINWERNKCYTYTLNFKKGFGYKKDGTKTAIPLSFNTTISDWQNADRKDVKY